MGQPGVKTQFLLAMSAVAALSPFFLTNQAGAAQMISRSVDIGTSEISATTYHDYSYTIPSAGVIGSIEFEYCTNTSFTDDPCTPPTGLDVSGATIGSQTGETGFSIHGSTNANKIVLTRAPSANLALQPVSYRFDNVVNQSILYPVFVRISTYVTDDASGAFTDDGTVIYSTVSAVQVAGFVPPFLTFCTGITVATDCTTTNGDLISLGEISKTSANFSTSQYSGATNDPAGFTTTLSGTTMTSGNNTIPALSTPDTNKPGTGQFGINLRDNSNPNVGQNKTSVGISSSVPQSGYNTPNQFKFANEVISASPLPTNFDRFTVSYLVNAPESQPAGIYSATLTFIATAAF